MLGVARETVQLKGSFPRATKTKSRDETQQTRKLSREDKSSGVPWVATRIKVRPAHEVQKGRLHAVVYSEDPGHTTSRSRKNLKHHSSPPLLSPDDTQQEGLRGNTQRSAAARRSSARRARAGRRHCVTEAEGHTADLWSMHRDSKK